MAQPTWLVTGGCGFIGGNFVRRQIRHERVKIINLDALTYAGNLDTLEGVLDHPDHLFIHGSITDRQLVRGLLEQYQPDAIVHFAAESHVDRSIDAPGTFVQTNVVGTFELLEAARHYWRSLPEEKRDRFRFLHVSTDEVYGSLGFVGKFTEETPYRPSSPYSASKAAADHFVRAYFKTYGLPTIITHCSNNYGPYQFPEKLIPLMILNALEGKPLPVYGEGNNIRDWLYVEDHCRALELVLDKGKPGESYNIGGNAEKTNLEVVRKICEIMDKLHPEGKPHERLITFVEDRPGHDFRYAMDTSKIRWQLGWQPKESFESGLYKTVKWYLENRRWWRRVCDGTYRRERLGLGR